MKRNKFISLIPISTALLLLFVNPLLAAGDDCNDVVNMPEFPNGSPSLKIKDKLHFTAATKNLAIRFSLVTANRNLVCMFDLTIRPIGGKGDECKLKIKLLGDGKISVNGRGAEDANFNSEERVATFKLNSVNDELVWSGNPLKGIHSIDTGKKCYAKNPVNLNELEYEAEVSDAADSCKEIQLELESNTNLWAAKVDQTKCLTLSMTAATNNESTTTVTVFKTLFTESMQSSTKPTFVHETNPTEPVTSKTDDNMPVLGIFGVSSEPASTSSSASSSTMPTTITTGGFPLYTYIGIATGVIFLIVIIVIICCVCKKSSDKDMKENDAEAGESSAAAFTEDFNVGVEDGEKTAKYVVDEIKLEDTNKSEAEKTAGELPEDGALDKTDSDASGAGSIKATHSWDEPQQKTQEDIENPSA